MSDPVGSKKSLRIPIRKSKVDRQHNGQKKKNIKLKIK